jgi:hypothetical protein
VPNRVRFDGKAERFYEVWYFIFNDRASGDGFWIRYTLLNPLDSRPEAGAALWFAHTRRGDPARSLAITRNFSRADFSVQSGELSVRIGDAVFEEGMLRGGFEAENHRVAWDLHYEPSPEPHYFFGDFLRRVSARRTSVTVPNPRIELSGEVTIDGASIAIDHARGHQAHHWGVERAPRWLWAHCCAFDEDDSAVVELLAPEIPGGSYVAFVNLRTATARYELSGVSSLARNRASAGLGFWQFEGIDGEHHVVADVTVDPRYVQRFVYVSPSYRSSECWNTQVGDCLVRVYRRASTGERLETVLRARGTCAAEVHDERPERIAYPSWWAGVSEKR